MHIFNVWRNVQCWLVISSFVHIPAIHESGTVGMLLTMYVLASFHYQDIA